jgi:hypothetical protein
MFYFHIFLMICGGYPPGIIGKKGGKKRWKAFWLTLVSVSVFEMPPHLAWRTNSGS